MKRARTIAFLVAVVAILIITPTILFLLPNSHWGSAKQSALHSAVLADDLVLTKTLLSKARIHSADEQLFYARSAPMAELLIASGASVNYRAHGNYTPLHFAAAMGAEDVVAMLLRRGADVNAINDGKVTPLMLAVGFGIDPDEGFEAGGIDMSGARQLAVVRLLLKSGARVDDRDSAGRTALCRAANGSFSRVIVPVLVEAGANINVRDADNDTPLHDAAFSGDLTTVRYLLEHGADVTVKEWQGKTPRDCVQGTGPEANEIRKLLTR